MSQAITPRTVFKNMGETNDYWGVCGFTSSLYAMWDLDATTRARLVNAPKPFTVLAEIKTYLRMLQAEGNTAAITEIEAFCQSFGGPFIAWTVNDYCDHVSAAVTRSEDEITGDGMFSIGMPPQWVADYLRRVWGYSSMVIEVPPGNDPGGDAIIGVVVPANTPNPMSPGSNVSTQYNRLVHYMYRRKGRIWSWGHLSYDSVDAARRGGASWAIRGWQVGWVITVGPKA